MNDGNAARTLASGTSIASAEPETSSRPLPGYNADAEACLAGSTEQARSPRARPRRSRCLATQR